MITSRIERTNEKMVATVFLALDSPCTDPVSGSALTDICVVVLSVVVSITRDII